MAGKEAAGIKDNDWLGTNFDIHNVFYPNKNERPYCIRTTSLANLFSSS